MTAADPAPPAPCASPSSLAPPLRRVLDRLGAGGVPLALDELARQLFALTASPPPALARRLVASALGFGAAALPERLDLRALPRLQAGPAADVMLGEAEWIVVDLETTGLSLDACTILEIGAVRVVGPRLVERFQTLVDPGMPIPPRITALTGIDRTLVDGAPTLARAIQAFHAWAAAGSAVPFVAHNAAFDERFVRRALVDHALPCWAGPVVCTRKLARRLLPALRRYDLDTLSAQFGIANAARHRALGDAEAAARALVELVAIGREERALATLGDLLTLQAEPVTRRRRRRARAARAAAPPDGA
ncbi:MAG TPA: 3'-5' exonuclease [Myxococcota bacterium]|nr:3'-5' exonuclease [Myxococcota bacterium]